MKVKASRQNMIRGLVYAILLSLLIVGIAGYIIFTLFLQPVLNRLNATSEPLPTYANITVREVCELLAINDEDPFCDGETDQNAKSLQEMLYRNFPIYETTYEEIMPFLKSLRSISSEMALQGKDFSISGCQLPVSSNQNDECLVIFPGEISIVSIQFDSAKTVIRYGVTGAQGGNSG